MIALNKNRKISIIIIFFAVLLLVVGLVLFITKKNTPIEKSKVDPVLYKKAVERAEQLYLSDVTTVSVSYENDRFVVLVKDKETSKILNKYYMNKDTFEITDAGVSSDIGTSG